MDPALDDQRRYLAALVAAAAPAPALHRCQLAALAREQALAAAAGDSATYRRTSGDLFETARAAWLDRLVAHARVAIDRDDPWTATAALVELEAALAARDHGDWTACLTAGSTAGQAWHARAATAKAAFANLIAGASLAAWDRRPGSQGEAAGLIAASVAALAELEPLAAGTVGALLRRPRYREVLPWAEAGLDALGALLAPHLPPTPGEPVAVEAVAATAARIDARVAAYLAGLPTAAPAPAASHEPTVAEVVAPYRGLLDVPGDAPAMAALRAAARRMIDAAAGARSPQALLAAWTEGGHLVALSAAPVIAEAEAVLTRQAAWPDPLRAAGARALIADVAAARTGTWADAAAMHHGACALVEASWARGLADVVLAPIMAACVAGWDPTGGPGVDAAWRLADAIAGVGGELIATPLAGQVMAAIVQHRQASELGAFLGETGHAIVGEARAWLAVAGVDARAPAVVAARLADAWGPRAPRPGATVRLWGQALAVDALGPSVPVRPPLPGRSAAPDP
ncbi:MAG: hypothetical protein JNK64_28890 [Myxococcales bacterium]|nr:hypothetical protein [Myxococcales bacterium]